MVPSISDKGRSLISADRRISFPASFTKVCERHPDIKRTIVPTGYLGFLLTVTLSKMFKGEVCYFSITSSMFREILNDAVIYMHINIHLIDRHFFFIIRSIILVLNNRTLQLVLQTAYHQRHFAPRLFYREDEIHIYHTSTTKQRPNTQYQYQ